MARNTNYLVAHLFASFRGLAGLFCSSATVAAAEQAEDDDTRNSSVKQQMLTRGHRAEKPGFHVHVDVDKACMFSVWGGGLGLEDPSLNIDYNFENLLAVKKYRQQEEYDSFFYPDPFGYAKPKPRESKCAEENLETRLTLPFDGVMMENLARGGLEDSCRHRILRIALSDKENRCLSLSVDTFPPEVEFPRRPVPGRGEEENYSSHQGTKLVRDEAASYRTLAVFSAEETIEAQKFWVALEHVFKLARQRRGPKKSDFPEWLQVYEAVSPGEDDVDSTGLLILHARMITFPYLSQKLQHQLHMILFSVLIYLSDQILYILPDNISLARRELFALAVYANHARSLGLLYAGVQPTPEHLKNLNNVAQSREFWRLMRTKEFPSIRFITSNDSSPLRPASAKKSSSDAIEKPSNPAPAASVVFDHGPAQHPDYIAASEDHSRSGDSASGVPAASREEDASNFKLTEVAKWFLDASLQFFSLKRFENVVVTKNTGGQEEVRDKSRQSGAEVAMSASLKKQGTLEQKQEAQGFHTSSAAPFQGGSLALSRWRRLPKDHEEAFLDALTLYGECATLPGVPKEDGLRGLASNPTADTKKLQIEQHQIAAKSIRRTELYRMAGGSCAHARLTTADDETPGDSAVLSELTELDGFFPSDAFVRVFRWAEKRFGGSARYREVRIMGRSPLSSSDRLSSDVLFGFLQRGESLCTDGGRYAGTARATPTEKGSKRESQHKSAKDMRRILAELQNALSHSDAKTLMEDGATGLAGLWKGKGEDDLSLALSPSSALFRGSGIRSDTHLKHMAKRILSDLRLAIAGRDDFHDMLEEEMTMNIYPYVRYPDATYRPYIVSGPLYGEGGDMRDRAIEIDPGSYLFVAGRSCIYASRPNPKHTGSEQVTTQDPVHDDEAREFDVEFAAPAEGDDDGHAEGAPLGLTLRARAEMHTIKERISKEQRHQVDDASKLGLVEQRNASGAGLVITRVENWSRAYWRCILAGSTIVGATGSRASEESEIRKHLHSLEYPKRFRIRLEGDMYHALKCPAPCRLNSKMIPEAPGNERVLPGYRLDFFVKPELRIDHSVPITDHEDTYGVELSVEGFAELACRLVSRATHDFGAARAFQFPSEPAASRAVVIKLAERAFLESADQAAGEFAGALKARARQMYRRVLLSVKNRNLEEEEIVQIAQALEDALRHRYNTFAYTSREDFESMNFGSELQQKEVLELRGTYARCRAAYLDEILGERVMHGSLLPDFFELLRKTLVQELAGYQMWARAESWKEFTAQIFPSVSWHETSWSFAVAVFLLFLVLFCGRKRVRSFGSSWWWFLTGGVIAALILLESTGAAAHDMAHQDSALADGSCDRFRGLTPDPIIVFEPTSQTLTTGIGHDGDSPASNLIYGISPNFESSVRCLAPEFSKGGIAVVSLLGQRGAGKSTLATALAGRERGVLQSREFEGHFGATTVGVWLLPTLHETSDGSKIWYLDTEGHEDPTDFVRYERSLLGLVREVSSYFLLVANQSLGRPVLRAVKTFHHNLQLYSMCHAAKAMCRDGKQDQSHLAKPAELSPMRLVMRDYGTRVRARAISHMSAAGETDLQVYLKNVDREEHITSVHHFATKLEARDAARTKDVSSAESPHVSDFVQAYLNWGNLQNAATLPAPYDQVEQEAGPAAEKLQTTAGFKNLYMEHIGTLRAQLQTTVQRKYSDVEALLTAVSNAPEATVWCLAFNRGVDEGGELTSRELSEHARNAYAHRANRITRKCLAKKKVFPYNSKMYVDENVKSPATRDRVFRECLTQGVEEFRTSFSTIFSVAKISNNGANIDQATSWLYQRLGVWRYGSAFKAQRKLENHMLAAKALFTDIGVELKPAAVESDKKHNAELHRVPSISSYSWEDLRAVFSQLSGVQPAVMSSLAKRITERDIEYHAKFLRKEFDASEHDLENWKTAAKPCKVYTLEENITKGRLSTKPTLLEILRAQQDRDERKKHTSADLPGEKETQKARDKPSESERKLLKVPYYYEYEKGVEIDPTSVESDGPLGSSEGVESLEIYVSGVGPHARHRLTRVVDCRLLRHDVERHTTSESELSLVRDWLKTCGPGVVPAPQQKCLQLFDSMLKDLSFHAEHARDHGPEEEELRLKVTIEACPVDGRGAFNPTIFYQQYTAGKQFSSLLKKEKLELETKKVFLSLGFTETGAVLPWVKRSAWTVLGCILTGAVLWSNRAAIHHALGRSDLRTMIDMHRLVAENSGFFMSATSTMKIKLAAVLGGLVSFLSGSVLVFSDAENNDEGRLSSHGDHGSFVLSAAGEGNLSQHDERERSGAP
ncbi:unnamed protein product [Amoebophrya sp. A25]|nr:unnamed protein product [Amoebophrya sp. A25]|eukprot:GSA25T00024054001.1